MSTILSDVGGFMRKYEKGRQNVVHVIYCKFRSSNFYISRVEVAQRTCAEARCRHNAFCKCQLAKNLLELRWKLVKKEVIGRFALLHNHDKAQIRHCADKRMPKFEKSGRRHQFSTVHVLTTNDKSAYMWVWMSFVMHQQQTLSLKTLLPCASFTMLSNHHIISVL